MPARVDEHLSVDAALGALAGRRVFFEPLSGNNGDDLIREGCELALRRAGLERVDRPDDAEAIVITGGGGMIESSKRGIGGLREHLDRRPEQAVIVLPQSYWFPTMDFASFFGARTAPTTLFARERYSLEMLRGMDLPGTVTVALDHDMALQLRGSEFIESLRAGARRRHVLIVERGDGEATTAARHAAIGHRSINRLIPTAVKTPLKRAIRRRQAAAHAQRSPYVQRMLAMVRAEHPEAADLPVLASDVSDRGNATFEGFCRSIADAAVVVTNRLHVGVLAAMLDRPTYLATNSYHKIRGIYEHSLADMPHVRFLQDTEG